ncbi:MAG: hypothetical protein INR73_21550 [Williamsia sp.]|nr:hypothetical protein [Williamsia sp.]
MKKFIFSFVLLVIFSPLFSQTGLPLKHHKIAVFVPLYLDSAFDRSNEYQYGKTFPKFLNPGLEFYEGIQLAADSLNKTAAAIDISVYDTRSSATSVSNVIRSADFEGVELIIGQVTKDELTQLADIAKKKNILFINSNLPNNYGITDNASLVILNSTLRTHIMAIHKFLQKTYSTTPIVVFTKKGDMEDRLLSYFTDIERNSASVFLKPKYVTLNANFTTKQLIPYLDSNRVTMCVAGSLDEQFAKQLCMNLAVLNKDYPVQVMGMPTWDGIKDFEKRDYKGLEIFYTTPFYNAKTDKASTSIINYFKNNLYSRPTDMVFRGFECLMRFAKMLLDNGTGATTAAVGEKKYRVFSDFDIQPVLNNQTFTLDYYENRKLYFVKLTDGTIRGVY